MSNVKLLADKLLAMGVQDFHVEHGPDWNKLTPEERAGKLLQVIEQIESGDFEIVHDVEGQDSATR